MFKPGDEAPGWNAPSQLERFVRGLQDLTGVEVGVNTDTEEVRITYPSKDMDVRSEIDDLRFRFEFNDLVGQSEDGDESVLVVADSSEDLEF